MSHSGLVLALLAQPLAIEPIVSPEARAAAAEFKTDAPKLIARLEGLAAIGDDSASELLGELYQRGGFAGMNADPVRACDWFEKTAERRGDSAQNFANCFFLGEGRQRDLPRARVFYGRAMTQGWPSAPCALGNMMVRGAGGPVDQAGGVKLCRQAAEAGNADAQTDLGNYLLSGTGTPKDVVEARKWYESAARQDQRNAAFILGQILWNGDGTTVDRTQAAKWWRVAYDGGRKDAAALLAKEAMTRLIVGKPGEQVVQIDRAVLPDAKLWAGKAASEDPDVDVRKKSADLLDDLNKIGAE